MARIAVHDKLVVVDFSLWEAPFVGRRRLEIGLDEIDEVTLVARPMRANLGARAGLWITGMVKVGLFGVARRCLTSVRRGQPAVRLRLRGGRAFHEVLVGDSRAEETARALAGVR